MELTASVFLSFYHDIIRIDSGRDTRKTSYLEIYAIWDLYVSIEKYT